MVGGERWSGDGRCASSGPPVRWNGNDQRSSPVPSLMEASEKRPTATETSFQQDKFTEVRDKLFKVGKYDIE